VLATVSAIHDDAALLVDVRLELAVSVSDALVKDHEFPNRLRHLDLLIAEPKDS
jgi:hypothetical protein